MVAMPIQGIWVGSEKGVVCSISQYSVDLVTLKHFTMKLMEISDLLLWEKLDAIAF